MSIVKSNTQQSYWDILPIEIQDLIIEIRNKNLYKTTGVTSIIEFK